MLTLARLLQPAAAAGGLDAADVTPPDRRAFWVVPAPWMGCNAPALHVYLADRMIHILVEHSAIQPVVIRRNGTEWSALAQALDAFRHEEPFTERDDIRITTSMLAHVPYQDLLRVLELAQHAGFTTPTLRHGAEVPPIVRRDDPVPGTAPPPLLRISCDAESIRVDRGDHFPVATLARDGSEWTRLRAVLRRLLSVKGWTWRTEVVIPYSDGRDYRDALAAVQDVRGW